MSSLEFKRQLDIGRKTEGAITRWLRSREHGVLTIYDIENKDGIGPRYFSKGSYVSPDLLCFAGNGETMWCEAKHKTVFSWHRKTKRWCTGIDIRHYEHYQKIQDETGLDVWLLFLHVSDQPDPRDVALGCPAKCPTGLFGRKLADLIGNENHRHDNWGRSGMVYWAHDKLRPMATVDAVLNAQPLGNNVRVNGNHKSLVGAGA